MPETPKELYKKLVSQMENARGNVRGPTYLMK